MSTNLFTNLLSFLASNNKTGIKDVKKITLKSSVSEKDLEMIEEIGKILVGNLNFSKLSQQIVDLMNQKLKAIGGVLFLPDKEKKVLYSHTVTTTNKLVRQALKYLPQPFQSHIFSYDKPLNEIGYSFKEDRLIIGTELDKFISPSVDYNTAKTMQAISGVKTCVCLPVKFQDELLGTLLVTFSRQITNYEIRRLKTFATFTGVAINNSRLYEQVGAQIGQLSDKTSDLSALLNISQIVATKETNLNKITQKVLNAIPEKLSSQGFLTGFLGLYDDKRKELYAHMSTQNLLTKKAEMLLSKLERPYESYRIPISANNLMIKAFKTKKITISSVFSDCITPPVSKKMANILQRFIGMNSAMIVPIVIHDQAIGILGFTMKQPIEEIDDRIKNLATAFTNHLAITLENAKYLENINAKSQDVAALFKLSQISATSLKTEKVAQKMMDSIPNFFSYLNYIGGMLSLYHENSGSVEAYVITQSALTKKTLGASEKDLSRYKTNIDKSNQDLIIQAIKTKDVQVNSNLENFFANIPKDICRKIQETANIKSAVAVPVVSSGKVKGVVVFMLNKTILQIDDRDKKIMLSFSAQMGIAIENTNLYEEIEKKSKRLKIMNKELQELVESKSNFLSIASHQLRTPVSIAKGMLSMLVEKKVAEQEKERFIKRTFLAIERLSAIIHDLLSANAIDSDKYKLNKSLIQVDDLIDQIIKERWVKLEEKQTVKLIYEKPSPATPLLNVDQNKIREIISNLIDNAIQYTPAGQVEIKTKVLKNNFIFEISDTGIGFEKADQEKLFKKISRLPNAMSIRSDGTGLGLFLVERIVKAHGGRVEAKSAGLNKGSVFKFQLPIK